MLEIFIYDHDAQMAKKLRGFCVDSIGKRDFDARVSLYESRLEAFRAAAGKTGDVSLYLLEALPESTLGETVRAIRADNAGHYLVLVLARMQDMLTMLPPYYRPSGYLLRPPEPEDVEGTVTEIYRDYRRAAAASEGGHFVFKVKAREFRIPYQSILFFESRNKRIAVCTAAQELEFADSLENIARNAPAWFLRVHKSFCVNLREITEVNYGAMSVTMSDGSAAFTSRTYKAELQRALQKLGAERGDS